MIVIVYSKPDCALCKKFKEKIARLEIREWTEVDVSNLQSEWEERSKDLARSAQAALSMNDGHLPTIEFPDGEVLDYSGAIKRIKNERRT